MAPAKMHLIVSSFCKTSPQQEANAAEAFDFRVW